MLLKSMLNGLLFFGDAITNYAKTFPRDGESPENCAKLDSVIAELESKKNELRNIIKEKVWDDESPEDCAKLDSVIAELESKKKELRIIIKEKL